MGDKAEKLNRFFAMLGEEGKKEGVSMPEFCKALVSRKNTDNAAAFSRVPFAERMVFMPHCMRVVGACKAVEKAHEWICARCGACPAAAIHQKAAELGYGAVKMLKGGSAVMRLLDENQPGAVLGVACGFEGALGIMECERRGIPVQNVRLSRDGCADTSVDTAEVFEVMEFIQP